MTIYEYMLTATIMGTAEAGSFKEGAKMAIEDADTIQEQIDKSNLNLNIRFELESLLKVDD